MSRILPRKPVPKSATESTTYVSLPAISDSTDSIAKSHAHGLAPETLSTPKPLARRSHMLGSLTIDLLSISVSLGLFIFAITGYCSRERLFTQREQKLLDIARITGTAFPFIFAFIIGRLLQNILQWRLEKSVDGLSLAYLSRSFTLGSAYAAPLRIRSAHWLPPALLLLWALSPLGSQAALRFIYEKDGMVVEPSSFRVHYTYPRATWDSACGGCHPDAHNAVFLTPLLSLKSDSGQDTWGNVKVPLLQYAEHDKDDDDGWFQLPWLDNLEYTSLVGIPSARLKATNNMTFTMKTWYWEHENATVWETGSSGPLLQAAEEHNGSTLLKNFTSIGNLWQLAIPVNWLPDNDTSSVPLTFELGPLGWSLKNTVDVDYKYGRGKNDTLRLELDLKHRPVELNVTCMTSICHATAVRKSSLPAGYPKVNDMIYFKDYFLLHFKAAFPSEHLGSPFHGGLEAYLSAPAQFPYTVLQREDLGAALRLLEARTLAHRLCQILNSYWIIDNQFGHAAGAFNQSDTLMPPGLFQNTSVTTSHDTTFLKASDFWFGALCLSSLAMILGSIVSAVLVFVRLAPDSLDFLAALSLHGEDHVLPGSNSYMSLEEKVRLYRDVRFSIGDIRADEDVGQVAIAGDGGLAPLKRGRLYM